MGEPWNASPGGRLQSIRARFRGIDPRPDTNDHAFTDPQTNYQSRPRDRWIGPAPDRRLLDTRTIEGPFTPKDQFFTTQHYGHPAVDPATYRLKVSGLVTKPLALSLDELRKMKPAELVAGLECSGNRRRLQGRCGNGRWTGVPQRAVLEAAAVRRRRGRLEALHLYLDRRHEGRAHPRVAGHGRHG